MSDTYNFAAVTNLLNYSVALNPTAAFPVDARSLFDSYDKAVAAARTAEPAGSKNTVYYIGEILTVVENGIVSHYSIIADPENTNIANQTSPLKAVGAQVLGDDKSIVIGNDGKVALKGFGSKYYKYVAADVVIEGEYTYPDAMPTDATVGSYVKVADVWYLLGTEGWDVAESEPNTQAGHVLTEGWKEGLNPQVIKNEAGTGYELAWFEPSTVTMEGLSQSMAAVQTSVAAIDNKVDANYEDLNKKITDETSRATTAEQSLSTRITQNTEAITILNGGSTVEGSVDYKLAVFLNAYLTGDGEESKIDTLKDVINWAETHNTEVASYGTDIQANKQAISVLETFVGKLPEDANANTVADYILEVVNAEKVRAEASEKTLQDDIDTLAAKALTDASKFATAEQGAKADTAIQSVIAGEQNGHLAVDGNDVTVFTLNPAKSDVLGGIMPDGSTLAVDENGVLSANVIPVAKISGLDTALRSTADDATAAANEYANETFIKKENISTSTNAAGTVEAASDGKVISEKLFMDTMSWKTTM